MRAGTRDRGGFVCRGTRHHLALPRKVVATRFSLQRLDPPDSVDDGSQHDRLHPLLSRSVYGQRAAANTGQENGPRLSVRDTFARDDTARLVQASRCRNYVKEVPLEERTLPPVEKSAQRLEMPMEQYRDQLEPEKALIERQNWSCRCRHPPIPRQESQKFGGVE